MALCMDKTRSTPSRPGNFLNSQPDARGASGWLCYNSTNFSMNTRIFPRISLLGLAFLAVAAVPFCAHATPVGDPLPGPTGLGAIPTTDTVAPGAFEASLDYERINISGADGHANTLPFANVTYGFGKGEIGASYLRQKTSIEGFDSTENYYTLHGKYRVYATPNGQGAVAVGAHYYDFSSESGFDLGNIISLYATGSYEFRGKTDRPIARVDAGLLGQRADSGDDTTTYARPFVGIEGFISPEVSVGADYLTKHGDIAKATTISLRYQSAKTPLSAQIGIGKLRSDTKFFVGVTYAFGRK